MEANAATIFTHFALVRRNGCALSWNIIGSVHAMRVIYVFLWLFSVPMKCICMYTYNFTGCMHQELRFPIDFESFYALLTVLLH